MCACAGGANEELVEGELFGEFIVLGELHETSCERQGCWTHAIRDHENEVPLWRSVDGGEEREREDEDEGAEEGEEEGDDGATGRQTTEPVGVRI